MYKYELVTLLEKVLMKSYEMKNGEHAFHCPFCNHHKKKLQVNTETQKWHCWVCNMGGHKISIIFSQQNRNLMTAFITHPTMPLLCFKVYLKFFLVMITKRTMESMLSTFHYITWI